jgi:hypothetical protein
MGAVATNEWGRERWAEEATSWAPGIRALLTATGDGRGGILLPSCMRRIRPAHRAMPLTPPCSCSARRWPHPRLSFAGSPAMPCVCVVSPAADRSVARCASCGVWLCKFGRADPKPSDAVRFKTMLSIFLVYVIPSPTDCHDMKAHLIRKHHTLARDCSHRAHNILFFCAVHITFCSNLLSTQRNRNLCIYKQIEPALPDKSRFLMCPKRHEKLRPTWNTSC